MAERRFWEPGEKEQLAKDYADGIPMRRLAKKYGRSEDNLRTVLAVIDACVRQQRLSEKQIKRLAALVRKGKTDNEIAEILKCSRSTVKRNRNLMALRKYKWRDMGPRGWPSGLQKNEIDLLVAIEKNRLKTLGELTLLLGKQMLAPLGDLLEKKMLIGKLRTHGVVHDLSDRVKAMRISYRKRKAA